MVWAKFDLPPAEVALLVVGEQPGQDEQRVERRPQLVRHVGEELRLVARAQRELLGLLLHREAGHLDLAVLHLDALVLLRQQGGLLGQLGVGLLQLVLAALELLRERLRLLQQHLGPHVRDDGVDDDADRLGELLEEGLVDLREGLERRQLDHAEDAVLEQDRLQEDARGRGAPEPGGDGDVVLRRGLDEDRAAVGRHLAHEPLARAVAHRLVVVAPVAVARGQLERRRAVVVPPLHEEEGAEARPDQRGELRHDQRRHHAQVALALHHAAEPGQVGVEPGLVGVAAGRLAQVHDHLVDRVLQLEHLAAGIDPDRPGQVALGDGHRHGGDRPHLVGEVGGHRVHRVGEVAPGARDALDVGLAAEAALGAHLAGDAGDLDRRTS